jgi:myosin heavy subunit
VALVIFIVLAVAGIGSAVWFFQQYRIVSQAVATHQESFDQTVAGIFRDRNWELSSQPGAEYGFRYGAEAYQDVAERLRLAGRYEDMRPLLGWETPQAVENALELTPAEGDYEAISGLLSFYEKEYQRLTERVDELQGQVKNQEQMLRQKTAQLEQVQQNLEQELANEVQKHQEAMAELRGQYEQTLQQYREARQAVQQCNEQLQQAREEWKQELAQARDTADEWKRLYQQLASPPQQEKLQPAGVVLDVEPSRDFVMLAGGEDAGRKRNETYVIYTTGPQGRRQRKAVVLVNSVFNKTSLATISSQTDTILEGDPFVSQKVWERFRPQTAALERPTEQGGASPAKEVETPPAAEPVQPPAEEEAPAEAPAEEGYSF